MAEKPKICENFCTHKPQPRVDYTPFLNGHHSPADRAGGLFKPAINGERLVVCLKKKISVCVFGLFGHVYITTGCFDRSVKTLDDVNVP